MRDESNFRGFAFVTLSGICHGLVIAALGMVSAATLMEGHTPSVEVSITSAEAGQAQPSAKPAPPPLTTAPVVAAPAAPTPVAVPAKKPAPSKVVKAYAPAGLPKAHATPVAKEKVEEPQAKDMVAVAPTTEAPQEMTPDVSEDELKPVKETAPEGVTAEGAADAVESEEAPAPVEETKVAQAEEVTKEEATPKEEGAPEIAAASNETAAPSADGTPAAPATPGAGEPTRSYLDLKQKPGNRAPEYPIEARRAGQQGSLEMMYFVTREGRVSQVKVVKSSGSKLLDDEAIRTISQYRYVPGQEGWTKHPVVFSLKGQAVPSPGRLRTMGAKGS